MHPPHSFTRQLLRCISPTFFGLLCSMCGITLLVLLHVLILSINAGVLVPSLFGVVSDQWVDAYDAHIVEPLNQLLHSQVISTVLLAIMWGIIGLLLAVGGSVIGQFVRDLHTEERSVALAAGQRVVAHPLRRAFWMLWVWRCTASLVIIGGTILLLPLMQQLLLRDAVLLQSASSKELAVNFGVILLGWTIIVHIYIVALRLLLLRTRIFGETTE